MDRKEALEIVRKNWPDGRHQIQEALEFLIPELAESEDEMIRKKIVHLVSYIDIPDDTREKWLAWLEKQKDELSAKPEALKKAYEKGRADAISEQNSKAYETAIKEATRDKDSAMAFLKSAGIVDENGNLAEMYCSDTMREKDRIDEGFTNFMKNHCK